jgi:probable rRNA maturation factor
MQALNARHRGKDYATDVLSFTYPEEQVDGMCFLGEVVIAPGVAARNACEYGVAVEAELRKLLVHGLLHLAGYDHETDSGEMSRLQKRILDRAARERFPLVAGKPKRH